MDAATGSLILSGVGTLLGFSAGRKADRLNEKLAQAQYEQDLANYNFQWQEAQDAYAYRMEDLEIAEWNLTQQRRFQELTALNEWIDADKARIFDYNNQVDAYNASVESYEKQLGFNNLANQLANNGARLAYQDHLIELGFDVEDVDTKNLFQELKIGTGRVGLQLKRRDAIVETHLKKGQLKNQLASRRNELHQKLQQLQLENLAAEGKVKNFPSSGRTARKHIAATLANSQRLGYALHESMNSSRREVGLNIDLLNKQLEHTGDNLDLADQEQINALLQTRIEYDQAQRQLHERLLSTNLNHEAQEQKRKLEKYNMDLQARKAIQPTPIMSPELARPYAMPTPVLQRPRAPRQGPAPRRYAAATGHGLAALGTGLLSVSSAVAQLGKD